MEPSERFACLTAIEIEQFLYGDLNPSHLAVFEQHFSHCESCMLDLVRFDEERSPARMELSNTLSMILDDTSTADRKSEQVARPKFKDVVLRERIGKGGFGEVYLGTQLNANNRKVAVKILLQKLASSQAERIFRQEISALIGVEHNNIARVYQKDVADDGTACIVMEYIEGQTLQDFARDVTVNAAIRLQIADELCKAVQHIHEQRIIHRDLKPKNILIQKRKNDFIPKVIDFGLSVNSRRSKFADLQRAGTVTYMAPEQSGHLADEISERTDIYSLGVCIFELLAGRKCTPLFQGEKTESYLNRKFDGSFQLPRLCDIPRLRNQLGQVRLRELDCVLARATSLAPSDRYKCVETLRCDLLHIQRFRPTSLKSGDHKHRTHLFLRRNRFLLLTGAIVATVLLVAGLSNQSQRNRSDIAVSEAGDFAKNLMDRVNPITAEEPPAKPSEEVIDMANAVSEESEDLGIRDTDPFLTARMTASNTQIALDVSEAAIPDLERIVVACEKRFGEEADDTLAAKMHLAGAYTRVNRNDEAVAIYLKAFAVWKERYGIHSSRALSVTYYIARVKARRGQNESALEMTDKIIEHYRPDPENGDNLLVGVRFVRAQSLFALARYQEAVLDYEFVEEGYREAGFAASHPAVLMVNNDLALAEAKTGNCASALARMTRVSNETKRIYPEGALAIDKAGINQAIIFAHCGRGDEGLELLGSIRSSTVHSAMRGIATKEIELVKQHLADGTSLPKP